jgi:DNA-binding LytR/AlgR family response regulator
MKVIIIEDELLAQAKLEAMLIAIDPAIKIEAKLNSVKSSIEWLIRNHAPDLAFVDIQLADDHSFQIFKKVQVTFPVIFTTAFDKYILESFEYNSIDYLLKPITEEKLRKSLLKVQKLKEHFSTSSLMAMLSNVEQIAPARIVVKKGTDYITINFDDVAYFFTEHRIVFVKDFSGRQFICDKTLAEIECAVGQKSFFRINRKFIASIKAIEKFKSDNGKIRVSLKPEISEDVFVSKETAPEFRKWIGKD